MKVKCITCCVKMKPYERDVLPNGDVTVRLQCPECGMESLVTYFKERVEDEFNDQEIINEYIDGQSENLQDSQEVLDNFVASNPLSPAFNVANYIMTRLGIKPDLTHIDDDLIRLSHRSPRSTFRIALNLDEGSVIYSFVDKEGRSIINPLPSSRNGLAYCDFTTVSGLNDICRDLDKVSAEFVDTETRGLK